MGTEIVVTTFAHLFLLGISVVARAANFIYAKVFGKVCAFSVFYKLQAILIFLASLLIPVYWLVGITTGYEFSAGYILIINTPITILCLFILMPVKSWKSLVSIFNKT